MPPKAASKETQKRKDNDAEQGQPPAKRGRKPKAKSNEDNENENAEQAYSPDAPKKNSKTKAIRARAQPKEYAVFKHIIPGDSDAFPNFKTGDVMIMINNRNTFLLHRFILAGASKWFEVELAKLMPEASNPLRNTRIAKTITARFELRREESGFWELTRTPFTYEVPPQTGPRPGLQQSIHEQPISLDGASSPMSSSRMDPAHSSMNGYLSFPSYNKDEASSVRPMEITDPLSTDQIAKGSQLTNFRENLQPKENISRFPVNRNIPLSGAMAPDMLLPLKPEHTYSDSRGESMMLLNEKRVAFAAQSSLHFVRNTFGGSGLNQDTGNHDAQFNEVKQDVMEFGNKGLKDFEQGFVIVDAKSETTSSGEKGRHELGKQREYAKLTEVKDEDDIVDEVDLIKDEKSSQNEAYDDSTKSHNCKAGSIKQGNASLEDIYRLHFNTEDVTVDGTQQQDDSWPGIIKGDKAEHGNLQVDDIKMENPKIENMEKSFDAKSIKDEVIDQKGQADVSLPKTTDDSVTDRDFRRKDQEQENFGITETNVEPVIGHIEPAQSEKDDAKLVDTRLENKKRKRQLLSRAATVEEAGEMKLAFNSMPTEEFNSVDAASVPPPDKRQRQHGSKHCPEMHTNTRDGGVLQQAEQLQLSFQIPWEDTFSGRNVPEHNNQREHTKTIANYSEFDATTMKGLVAEQNNQMQEYPCVSRIDQLAPQQTRSSVPTGSPIIIEDDAILKNSETSTSGGEPAREHTSNGLQIDDANIETPGPVRVDPRSQSSVLGYSTKEAKVETQDGPFLNHRVARGPPRDICHAWNNFFLMLYGTAPDISRSDIKAAIKESELLISIAQGCNCVPAIRPFLGNALLHYTEALYKAILADPPRLLQVGFQLENTIIFKEAMVHIVGKYPHWPWAIKEFQLPKKVMRLIKSKCEELESLKWEANESLFTHTIYEEDRRFSLKPKNKESLDIWTIVQLWRDWFTEQYRSRMDNERSSFDIEQLYRLIGGSPDGYLTMDYVLTQFKDYTIDGPDTCAVVTEILRLMKENGREAVARICENHCSLDVEKSGIKHLTCTTIEQDELPWNDNEEYEECEK